MSSPQSLLFSSLLKKPVAVDFTGGQLSSDAGVLPVAELDRRLGLTAGFAACLRDARERAKTRHSLLELVRQRVYQIACGYEDANDADTLRGDPLFKTAVGRAPRTGADLASQPTLSRLENAPTPRELLALSRFLVEHFAERHAKKKVVRIVLDLDATHDPLHGQQEFCFFHGYYGTYCYLPLLVWATVTVEDPDGAREEEPEQELLVAMLRPGNHGAAYRAVSVLRRLVEQLRERWPKAEMIVRADSGFATPELYGYCEDAGVAYCLGLARNAALLQAAEPWMQQARKAYAAQQVELGENRRPVRVFGEFRHQAGSWEKKRTVTCKAEVLPKGENPRFYVTFGLPADLDTPERRWGFYNARGDRENRIKELKLDLRADKTSCHRFAANQFRLLMHALAYILLQQVRKLLAGTEWAAAQVSTLQIRLLKVAARVRESCRRVHVQLPTSYPWQALWLGLVGAIRGG